MTEQIALLRSWLQHTAHLRALMGRIAALIVERGAVHDLSKLNTDEFEGFARINRVAREQKFGSPEYEAAMERERPTIDLHFSRNRHHPERPRLIGEAAERERGLPDDATYHYAVAAASMEWLDIVEMVCDWRAAQLGYGDTSRTWEQNVELNLQKKGQHLNECQAWLARSVARSLEVERG